MATGVEEFGGVADGSFGIRCGTPGSSGPQESDHFNIYLPDIPLVL